MVSTVVGLSLFKWLHSLCLQRVNFHVRRTQSRKYTDCGVRNKPHIAHQMQWVPEDRAVPSACRSKKDL